MSFTDAHRKLLNNHGFIFNEIKFGDLLYEALVLDRDIVSGWVSTADDGWVYGSATTLTASGDLRTKYQIGDKLRFTFGTATQLYYTVIVGISYNATTKTTTITTPAAFSGGQNAITNIYYSKAENPQGFPHWFDWSPTYTYTDGSPGIDSRYTRYAINGRTVNFIINMATNDGAGITNLVIHLPVTPKPSGNTPVMAAYVNINSTHTINLMEILAGGADDGLTFVEPISAPSGQYFDLWVQGFYEI